MQLEVCLTDMTQAFFFLFIFWFPPLFSSTVERKIKWHAIFFLHMVTLSLPMCNRIRAIATLLSFNQLWGHSKHYSPNHSAPHSVLKHQWVVAKVLMQASPSAGWNLWCNRENRTSAYRGDSSFPLESFRRYFNIRLLILC